MTERSSEHDAILGLCGNHGFATGHGDTLADIIHEVDGQIAERDAKFRRIMKSLYHAWATDTSPSREALDFCKEQFED